MEASITCECGNDVTVRLSMAGSTVQCPCGQNVSVPPLSQLKQFVTSDDSAPTRPPLSWKKKLTFTVVFFLIVALPCYLLAEVIYRAAFQIPITGGITGSDGGRLPDTPSNRQHLAKFRRSENPILGYEPNPGASSDIYSINSEGFRDHQYTVTPEPDVFRIVVLGDSIIWGHGLELKHTFAKQLEVKLNEHAQTRFEVLNFGVSGYSTQQEVELYRVKASQYNPDLVIVGYCLNDFVESSVEGAAFKQLYFGVFRKSYLYDHLRRALAGVTYNHLGYIAGQSAAEFDLHEQFQLLESHCAGVPHMVVVFPHFVDFDNYFFAVEHERVKNALDGLDYEVLDLLEVYSQYAPRALKQIERDRVHPNAFGTQLAAQATAERLIQNDLVPARSQ